MSQTHRPGQLFLVPTPLDFGCNDPTQPPPLTHSLPDHTLATAARIGHWITENAKSTRAFLKRVDATHPLQTALQAQCITELPRDIHKKGDHTPGTGNEERVRLMLAPALAGHDVGLISEAGMPAIADPGTSVVRAAHGMGLRVNPLTGPVSPMLALAASGLNGQHFAFVGYVPQDSAARAKRLRDLERQAWQHAQTQILIETPYRNRALLQALLDVLKPDTRLAVCTGLALEQMAIHSAKVQSWRAGAQPRIHLELPAVFLLGP